MSTITELDETTFEAQVAQPGLTVIDFWAPCRAMAPQPERAAKMHPQYRFTKVNVDENQSLAAAYGVQAIRTLAVLRDGELVGADQLVEALDRVAA